MSLWLEQNPTALLAEEWSRRVASGMEPRTYPALPVAVPGFRRCRGDWLGVVITPARLELWLLDGGGELWGRIPLGQKRFVSFPAGDVGLVAGYDPLFGAYQAAPVVPDLAAVPDAKTALLLAEDMLNTLVPPEPAAAPEGEPQAAAPSRRGFFRRLAGKS
ncbi:MAG: hypothetical protein RIR00_1447 [Pseudomonadota bacterium]|jgi:[NiFe] hydrogenase assembly HybE family chaperone